MNSKELVMPQHPITKSDDVATLLNRIVDVHLEVAMGSTDILAMIPKPPEQPKLPRSQK